MQIDWTKSIVSHGVPLTIDLYNKFKNIYKTQTLLANWDSIFQFILNITMFTIMNKIYQEHDHAHYHEQNLL